MPCCSVFRPRRRRSRSTVAGRLGPADSRSSIRHQPFRLAATHRATAALFDQAAGRCAARYRSAIGIQERAFLGGVTQLVHNRLPDLLAPSQL